MQPPHLDAPSFSSCIESCWLGWSKLTVNTPHRDPPLGCLSRQHTPLRPWGILFSYFLSFLVRLEKKPLHSIQLCRCLYNAPPCFSQEQYFSPFSHFHDVNILICLYRTMEWTKAGDPSSMKNSLILWLHFSLLPTKRSRCHHRLLADRSVSQVIYFDQSWWEDGEAGKFWVHIMIKEQMPKLWGLLVFGIQYCCVCISEKISSSVLMCRKLCEI